MQLRPSTRREVKMKLALQGSSGSGKTYSSLLIAYGIVSDWSKIARILLCDHKLVGWSERKTLTMTD